MKDALVAAAKRWPERTVGLAVVALVIGALGFIGLFARPSYEMALAAGLLCPGVAACVVALELSRRSLGPLAMLSRAVETGLMMVAAAYAMGLLHGLRAGFCDLGRGSVLFVMGPGVGAVLGGVWGAVASEVARGKKRRRLWATALGLGGPLGSALFQVGFFYTTPIIFAYDPFVGYFSGALYDTVLADAGLGAYRLASLATLFAIYVASLHAVRDEEDRLRWRPLGRPGLLVVGGLAALGSLVSVIRGPRLGHWQTGGTIAEALGGEVTEGRCRVVFDARLPGEHVYRFARDCHAHIEAIEAWLGTPEGKKLPLVTAYLFHDVGQKRHFMGAGRTSIAKPWRREVYLQNEAYPHRVLGHELVHVLAGPHGQGPFAIAGRFGGWLPNPGLIEGIAVAGSPRDDNLTADEWSAAMKQIGVLPGVGSLFGLSFFGNASSTSYTAAGSFVGWVRAKHGPETITRWYAGEALATLTGTAWPDLQVAWHQHLDAIALREAALVEAKARFDRPSLFGRRCPHIVDETMGQAGGALGSGNIEAALEGYRKVLDLDPSNFHAKLALASCFDKQASTSARDDVLETVATDPNLTRAIQNRAVEQQGDLALRVGKVERARALYDRIRPSETHEGRLRTLDLKHHYAADPLARQVFVDLLVGTDGRGAYNLGALDRIGQWRNAQPEDGTPDYLFARQHLGAARFLLAERRLEAALERDLPVPRARSESLRMLVIARCAQGDREQANEALAQYVSHPLVAPSRADYYRRLVARCGSQP